MAYTIIYLFAPFGTPYLSGLARRKVDLRKVVYPAWVGERLFIRSSSEESWSGKSCLSGLGR